MPEATAQLTPPVPEQPIDVENRLNQIRQSAGRNADEAIGNKGAPHNPTPVIEMGIPVHVPADGSTFTKGAKKGELDVPGTFRANANDWQHLVNFTGEGAPPRTGDAGEVNRTIRERNDAALKVTNNPKGGSGIVTLIKDFFYDTDKAA